MIIYSANKLRNKGSKLRCFTLHLNNCIFNVQRHKDSKVGYFTLSLNDYINCTKFAMNKGTKNQNLDILHCI